MGGSGMFTYAVIIIGIFYFMLYRPQQKQRRQREELIASLEVGKKVVTIGGIHGEIKKIDGETITLEIAEGVEVEFQKTAIAFAKKDPELDEEDDTIGDGDEETGNEEICDNETGVGQALEEEPVANDDNRADDIVSEDPAIMDEPVNEDTTGKG